MKPGISCSVLILPTKNICCAFVSNKGTLKTAHEEIIDHFLNDCRLNAHLTAYF